MAPTLLDTTVLEFLFLSAAMNTADFEEAEVLVEGNMAHSSNHRVKTTIPIGLPAMNGKRNGQLLASNGAAVGSKPVSNGKAYTHSIQVGSKEEEEPITWIRADTYFQQEMKKQEQKNGNKEEKPNGLDAPEPVMQREPSYVRLSRVLNGYINNARMGLRSSTSSRAKTPEPHAGRRSYESPLAKKAIANNNNNHVNYTPRYESSNQTSRVKPGVTPTSSAHVVDARLEPCSIYSFKIPNFSPTEPITDGAGYKKLVEEVLILLKSHLERTSILLEHQDLLPESVAEIVRVAVGRTDLLLKKRMKQFTQQLYSHQNPAGSQKLTTINDLEGLWSLVDIQLDDIRACFDQLTTASSMPSLVLRQQAANGQLSNETNQKPPTGSKAGTANNKQESKEQKEKEQQRKATMEAKRKELDNKRKALIEAKRAEQKKLLSEQQTSDVQ
ncbi:guanylate-kinase-associated protein (GKAP) protein domain-containing protein [Ditylenchus destructor]|uniref:Guanylate-kinase-associated protein (GKAP) protein domain-containing protein n=1 Tax=Ditylenchus destructor TaxID=166010 RepID=A0AAD4N7Q2_9BILA|nr:guanylate-kinase-associated protein (GKAP) protein domain-containing protein [Ditylenchus destructor]